MFEVFDIPGGWVVLAGVVFVLCAGCLVIYDGLGMCVCDVALLVIDCFVYCGFGCFV